MFKGKVYIELNYAQSTFNLHIGPFLFSTELQAKLIEIKNDVNC